MASIYIRKAYDSIMHGYFCIGFIDFMLNKSLMDFAKLFSLNSFKKNDKNNTWTYTTTQN